MIATDGWLVAPKDRKLTPNRYHAGKRRELIAPAEGIVLHYTASGSMDGSVAWLCDPASEAAAHFVIGRDGKIVQLAPLYDRTWHAGGTRNRPSQLFGRGNVNGRTISIELMNWGPLRRDAHGQVWSVAGPTPRRFTGEVFEAEPSNTRMFNNEAYALWEAFPEPLMVSLIDIMRDILAALPAIGHRGPAGCVGHEDVDPGRKIDPGPAFPWYRIRNALFPNQPIVSQS